jgi:hypothetical protein
MSHNGGRTGKMEEPQWMQKIHASGVKSAAKPLQRQLFKDRARCLVGQGPLWAGGEMVGNFFWLRIMQVMKVMETSSGNAYAFHQLIQHTQSIANGVVNGGGAHDHLHLQQQQQQQQDALHAMQLGQTLVALAAKLNRKF